MDGMGNSLVLKDPAATRYLRSRYPSAMGIGYAEGWRHQLTRELKIRAKRHEVVPMWRYLKEKPGGIIHVPVVFLKTPGQILRAKIRRIFTVALPALAVVAGVLYALWTIRTLILTGLGVAAGIAALLILLPHWSNGCPGLHCSGCKG